MILYQFCMFSTGSQINDKRIRSLRNIRTCARILAIHFRCFWHVWSFKSSVASFAMRQPSPSCRHGYSASGNWPDDDHCNISGINAAHIHQGIGPRVPVHICLLYGTYIYARYFNAQQLHCTQHKTRRIPGNTKHLCNICTTSDQRLRRSSTVVQILYKWFVFAGMLAHVESQMGTIRCSPSI